MVDAVNNCRVTDSLRTSSRPWVRQGSSVINRSTAASAVPPPSASIVEVIPPTTGVTSVASQSRCPCAQVIAASYTGHSIPASTARIAPVTDVRPPRPHTKLTDDGRRMQEVLTYARRGSRFTPQQAEGWAAHQAEWVIPDAAVDMADFDLASWWDRDAPLIVEIGSGIGEATAALAATRPEANILAFEVWLPGVADSLWRVAEAGADNVRFCSIDAVWSLEHLVGQESLSELWTFFPDPWHKTKHHKRRLVTPRNVAMAARRLRPDGVWRLATDWADYAQQMSEVLDSEPLLTGGPVDRWQERPITRFERKGLEKGRTIADFAYTRVG